MALTKRGPVFRPDYMFWWEQQGEYMERRQLFLRSAYQFSREKTARQRLRGTMLRARGLVWARLRDARRLPRLLWSNFRRALDRCRAALPGSGSRRRGRSHRLASGRGGVQFQRLPHRRTASSSSGSSAGAEWYGW